MTLKILSLGAGVQSSTLALMMSVGEIQSADCAIFADTQSEPNKVYEWLDRLELTLPFPVHRVTKGNLMEDGLILRTSKKSGKVYLKTDIPLFVAKTHGSKGMLRRKCTRDYKIIPIIRKVKELVGAEQIRQWKKLYGGGGVNLCPLYIKS